MSAADRTRAALVYAFLVAVAQALCFGGMFVGGELIAAQQALQAKARWPPTGRRRGEGIIGFVGVSIWLVSAAGLLIGPVFLHDQLGRTRWAPHVSRTAAVAASGGGLVAGAVLGSLLTSTPSWEVRYFGTRLAALVGSFVGLFLADRLSSGPDPGPLLGL